MNKLVRGGVHATPLPSDDVLEAKPRAASCSKDTGILLTCPDVDNSIRWKEGERFHDLFDAKFAEWGDGTPAVDLAEGRVTYAELLRLSNWLARHIIDEGVAPGDRVGLLFDRSVWAYAAMLAISKAGAAWVPLDRGFPTDRIAYICKDADVSLVLSAEQLSHCLSEIHCPFICLSEDVHKIASHSVPPLEACPRQRDALSYIIYTSGSTGRPKGVAVNHSSICNFIRAGAEIYELKEGARIYQGMTIAFDFSFEEIWIPFYVGATLVPAPPGGALLGEDLAEFLREREIDAICCVPTLLATMDEEELSSLDFVLVSGEACPASLVDRWHRPGRNFLNVYGPTEAAVTCTWARNKPGEAVTIGRPLPTYTITILDDVAHRALPQGEVGEIAVAGIGVAEGYINRPDKTEAAFIPDFLEIDNNPGQRLYRTGDLGRITPTGEIEYMGRIDTQVKIRGYRIELSEIESVLMQVPGMRQAVVEAWEAAPGVKELVAYYTLKADASECDPDLLHEMLHEKLPGYMVPAYLEMMEELPMLPSNKVDRKKLPPPCGHRHVSHSNAHVPPETDEEKALAGVLASVLGLKEVSVVDHFIDELGANSLLMSRFCAEVRRSKCGLSLTIKDVYLHPTLRDLASHLVNKGEAAAAPESERIHHVATDTQYWVCGAAQAVTFAIVATLLSAAVLEALFWIAEAANAWQAHSRAFLAVSALVAAAILLPLYLKWGLIGRVETARIPVWSFAYYRFWLVRSAIRANPLAMFAGTPLYNAYLRALGAQIGKNAMVGCAVPGAPDLFEVGSDAVLRRSVVANCYHSAAGAIETGPVRVGEGAFVGSMSVLEIQSEIGDQGQLAHASCLTRGQSVPSGKSYHGSPAEETQTNFRRISNTPRSGLKSWVFSLMLFALLLEGGAIALFVAEWIFSTSLFDLADRKSTSFDIALLREIGVLAIVVFVLFFALSALIMFGVARLFRLLLEEGTVYSLYGLRHLAWLFITGLTNSNYFNTLLGDSAFVVGFLKVLGYRLDPVVQTGSNFGLAQGHDVPDLCHVGSGTLVSDGLSMINADYSINEFSLSVAKIGANCFIGNSVVYPNGAMVGDNCMLATKVMVPVDGELRQNVGLLGSPSFEIPRSVLRDKQLDHYREPDVLKERLKLKNRSNGVAIAMLLAAHFAVLLVLLVFLVEAIILYSSYGLPALMASILSLFILMTAYSIFMERAALGFRRLEPLDCSIYDDRYWRHERFWKYSFTPVSRIMSILSGTPFRGFVLRLLGVRVGRRLFDDGAWISEKSMTEIGDDCTLSELAVIQGHSLEDAAFKSDRVHIGNRCSIGINAFVHLGVVVENDATIEPDSFVMKGTQVPAKSRWRGNPAHQIS